MPLMPSSAYHSVLVMETVRFHMPVNTRACSFPQLSIFAFSRDEIFPCVEIS